MKIVRAAKLTKKVLPKELSFYELSDAQRAAKVEAIIEKHLLPANILTTMAARFVQHDLYSCCGVNEIGGMYLYEPMIPYPYNKLSKEEKNIMEGAALFHKRTLVPHGNGIIFTTTKTQPFTKVLKDLGFPVLMTTRSNHAEYPIYVWGIPRPLKETK